MGGAIEKSVRNKGCRSFVVLEFHCRHARKDYNLASDGFEALRAVPLRGLQLRAVNARKFQDRGNVPRITLQRMIAALDHHIPGAGVIT